MIEKYTCGDVIWQCLRIAALAAICYQTYLYLQQRLNPLEHSVTTYAILGGFLIYRILYAVIETAIELVFGLEALAPLDSIMLLDRWKSTHAQPRVKW